MSKLQKLMDKISKWSDKTFGEGERNLGMIQHLKKEVDELLDDVGKYQYLMGAQLRSPSEVSQQRDRVLDQYADCFTLLFDSADKFGLTVKDIRKIMKKKLKINKKRVWGQPDKDGVVEHVRDGKM